ncbi:RraA family protein [Pseudomonas lundensis]|uniref:RraA family protein n=1 Tax=Serratia proteamaculans TaxID=28151 RepID=UPI0029816B77|nr:RraA family protein [Serratia proteamaculans]MDW5498296.1 RraA family protein [Serratia proteamaculans]MDW5503354.1 RraA family protein [Pseudomonas lundensis]
MQFELLSPQLLAEFKTKKISTSTVIDILDGLNAGDALTPEIYAINMSEHYLVAQAYTVCWKMVRKGSDILQPQPSTWSQVSPFLVPELHSGTGLVYVAGAGPLITNAALAGGMSCTYFDQMGFAGVILGGAVRDLRELELLAMPVLASNPIPTDTQGAYWVAETGTQCLIEQVRVQSGDLVVSDINGTVVVPLVLAEQVLQQALAIDSTENAMLDKIRQGARLPELINMTGRI